MKNIIKIIGIVGLGLGLMGNEGCEKQPPVVEKRILKWYADAGAVRSPVVQFGEAGNFDFGYVASEQLYGVLFNSKGFTASYSGPAISMSNQGPTLVGAQGMYQKMFGTSAIGSDLYFSEEARCLINLPDVKVEGSVLSFEMSSGNSISIGFNQPQGVVHTGFGLGAKFNVKVKELSLQMRAFDIAKDLNNGRPKLIAAPLVRESSKDTDGKVDLSYNMISAGYSWYKSTPLSKVTERALVQSINQIKDEMNKVPWTTKILDLKPFGDEQNPLGDLGYVIKGGADVNLKMGDQVEFYQDVTMWKGKPCESEFNGFNRINPRPIAIGEVVYLDRNFSTVAILQRFDNRKILPGWRVQLAKRIEDIEAEKKQQTASTKPKK
ncbi:MAG: hypothetical protein ACK5W9_02595 [Bdellovibrionales bacterium]